MQPSVPVIEYAPYSFDFVDLEVYGTNYFIQVSKEEYLGYVGFGFSSLVIPSIFDCDVRLS